MALPSGRRDKRIRKEVVAELVRPDAPEPNEVALVQNGSACGVRVATQRTWHPGDNVLLSSPESGFRTQARVVYCHRRGNGPKRVSSSQEPLRWWYRS